MHLKKRNLRSLLVILAVLFVTLVLGYSATVRGDIHEVQILEGSYNLTEGKNLVTFDRVILVKDLVRANPEIQAVSYYDPSLETTLGFVNVFGGVGKNFLITPGTTCEISVLSNVTLRL